MRRPRDSPCQRQIKSGLGQHDLHHRVLREGAYVEIVVNPMTEQKPQDLEMFIRKLSMASIGVGPRA